MLYKEISILLVIKVLAVFALSYFLFSNPVSKTLTPSKVGDAVFGITSHSLDEDDSRYDQ